MVSCHLLMGMLDTIRSNMVKEDIERLPSSPTRNPLLYCDAIRVEKARETYQRIAITILHDLMHKEAEEYVDDMIIKSKERVGHVPTLWK